MIDPDPPPALAGVLPKTLKIGSVHKLDLYGQRFEKDTLFFLGTQQYKIAWQSATYAEVTVDLSKGSWTAGSIQATVRNPKNGKTSKPVTLTLTK